MSKTKFVDCFYCDNVSNVFGCENREITEDGSELLLVEKEKSIMSKLISLLKRIFIKD